MTWNIVVYQLLPYYHCSKQCPTCITVTGNATIMLNHIDVITCFSTGVHIPRIIQLQLKLVLDLGTHGIFITCWVDLVDVRKLLTKRNYMPKHRTRHDVMITIAQCYDQYTNIPRPITMWRLLSTKLRDKKHRFRQGRLSLSKFGAHAPWQFFWEADFFRLQDFNLGTIFCWRDVGR